MNQIDSFLSGALTRTVKIYKLYSLCNLFAINGFESEEDQKDELMQSMVAVLGPMPSEFLQLWTTRSKFLNADRTLLEKIIQEGVSEPLNELIDESRPEGITDKQVELFGGFLRYMLQYSVEQRASTVMLLDHPWINANT